MKLIYFLLILIPKTGTTQEKEIKQLQFLLGDLNNNFIESMGEIMLEKTDTFYSSKTNLEGTFDNKISIGERWAANTAFMSDSCDFKDAKKLADYWKNIIQKVVPVYKKTKLQGKQKTSSGHPFYGYDFALIDDKFKYWISISYAERYFNKGYFIFFILGRERFIE